MTAASASRLGKQLGPFQYPERRRKPGRHLRPPRAGSHDEDHRRRTRPSGVFTPAGSLAASPAGWPGSMRPGRSALGSATFGPGLHQPLIGNFGDGTVHAFDLFAGSMCRRDARRTPPGRLWHQRLLGFQLGGARNRRRNAHQPSTSPGWPNRKTTASSGSWTAGLTEQPRQQP